MKKLLLLIFGVLLFSLSVNAISFSYVPGIYDETLEVNHLVADVVYVQIEQSIGNQAYDWLSFIPKSKTYIIKDYTGAKDVPIRWNIPKNANVGTYQLQINAFNQDNKLLKTYDIELVVSNKNVVAMKTFFSKTVDFKLFELTYLAISIILAGVVGMVFLFLQIKKWLFG
jgi:hypothetical protein